MTFHLLKKKLEIAERCAGCNEPNLELNPLIILDSVLGNKQWSIMLLIRCCGNKAGFGAVRRADSPLAKSQAAAPAVRHIGHGLCPCRTTINADSTFAASASGQGGLMPTESTETGNGTDSIGCTAPRCTLAMGSGCISTPIDDGGLVGLNRRTQGRPATRAAVMLGSCAAV